MSGEEQLLGDPVESASPRDQPSHIPFTGQFVELTPVDANRDIDNLYNYSHGSPDANKVWTYMAYGPFGDRQAMKQWLTNCQASSDPLFFTVTAKQLNAEAAAPDNSPKVGMVSISNIQPEMQRLELGHIWYAPQAQRTRVNTESIYLLLCEAFGRLNYRRVEWKCDALNTNSRNAALRLGFSYEGTFKQHMVVKGRNRDTAWFAMLDSEWPTAKEHMERWLYSGDSEVSLWALNQPHLRRAFF